MKKRNLAFVFAAVIILAIVFAAIVRGKAPRQVVVLPNGERYRFVAAVWGTRHMPPTMLARLSSRLPASATKWMPQRLANYLGPVPTFTLPQPCLYLWFRLENLSSQQPSSLSGLLEDGHGVASGGTSGRSTYPLGNVTWLTMTFPVVPRRCAVVQCRLFQVSADQESHREIGLVRFPNPLFGQYPQWQPETSPETLPATKAAGDIRVRLKEFIVATENKQSEMVTNEGKITRFHSPGPGDWRQIVFKLDIETPRGTNIEPWLIQRAELSDATGNRVTDDSSTRWSITDEYHFGPALWPDEAAWRLTLDVERNREFDSEELVTFTNVPAPAVGATNTMFLTNLVHGVPVVLKQQFIWDAVSTMPLGQMLPPTHVDIEILNHLEGLVVDFFRLKSDTGWTQTQWYNKRATNCTILYLYQLPRNVRTLDLTWSIQKKRTVEFLIKPPEMK